MTAVQQGPSILTWQVPNARRLLWESPFWISFLLIALIPASRLPILGYLGIPLRFSDMLVLAGGALYGSLWIFTLAGSKNGLLPNRLVLGTLLLFAIGAFSLLGANLDSADKSAMAYTLILAACCPLQAAGILSRYRAPEIISFMNRLVMLLGLICFVYTAESVFDLGLRSEEGRNLGMDFGIQRVRGPLFGPSTGYLILLPALGWSLFRIFHSPGRRTVWILLAASLSAALLGLGSRAAIILLLVYVTFLALATRQLKKKVLILSLVICALGSMAFVIYSQADTQRLQSLEDSHRRTTHETAWNIITTHGLSGLFTGQGYGTIWPWYRRDTLRTNWIAVGDNTVTTPYGISLYHCHSTVLELLVEFGTVGLLWLGFTTANLWALARRSSDTGWRSFSLALAISLLAFFFDLFIFKESRINAVWWIFVVAGLALKQPAARGAGQLR